MNIHDALLQISEIRQRMAWSVTFRGYRASTTALTSVIAITAALLQAWRQPEVGVNVYEYLSIWFTAAIAGVIIVAIGFVLRRGEYADGHIAGALTVAATECVLPPLLAGVLVTYAIVFFQPFAMIGLLPGLWMILFSLGIFASRRLLPRAVFVIAGYYLLCGLICLTLYPRQAFSPWTMGGVFGIGQMLAAFILYYTLERPAALEGGK
jgi:hypothetical protein